MSYIIPSGIAFLIAITLAPFAIPVLRRLKFGQEIREEGPKWHASKSGTPTMGGIIFIIGIIISGIIFLRDDFKGIMLIYLSVAFGAVGFFDDYIKVVQKRNLGLTAIQKLLMQTAASVIFVYLLYINGMLPTVLKIPFTSISWNMGLWYLPFVVIFIIGMVNAVNLTDGIDGLASSVTIIVCLFFAVFSKMIGNDSSSIFSAIIAGGAAGFLIFNKYPAKIFMGDTGSLFLGGCLAGIAVADGLALFLVIAGGIYILETISVIIQVTSFKLTGKRVFKMSPIHHHFEMCGWSENKIDTIFSFITIVLCVLAYIGR